MSNFKVDLSGKTALVAGGGDGVGRAIALALAEAGANVGVMDLNPDRADAIPAIIRERGGRATGFQGDIANRFQVSAFIERTRDTFGKLDIAVNAVGAFQPTALQSVDEWDVRRQAEVNLVGSYFFVQLVSRVLQDDGGGAMVMIANSYAAHTLAGGAPYLATKSAVITLARQAARELAPHNIRVNAVCAGNIADDDLPTHHDNMLKRPGTPEDVAHATLFLLSDGAAFITGQALNVDGGIISL